MDEVIVRLRRFFKHVRVILTIVREHCAASLPNSVSTRGLSPRVPILILVVFLTCLLLQEEIHLFCTAPPPPKSDGSHTTPRVRLIAVVQKVIEEEEEEESEDFSSFNSLELEAAEKFSVMPRPSNKVGFSFGTSKCEAKDVLETGVVPPPKRRRTATIE